MIGLVERLFEAAAHAGLLVCCTWHPPDGASPKSARVGFSAPDETLLDGLASATGYQMSYPASKLKGLAVRDTVEIGGARYQVRDIRAVGDGSEFRARLTRL